MKKFEKILDTVMRFLLALSMFAMLAFGTWQIASRWLLGKPSTFTDELLRYLLIWASLIGSAYCFYRDDHLALDLVKSRVKGPVAVLLSIFIEAMTLFFVCFVFIYGGMKLSMNALNISSVMHLPFTFLYSVLPISGVFIVVARVIKYLQLALDRKGDGV